MTDADTYGLTLDEISKLTVRQIYFMYYSERNKEGKRTKLPYYFISEDQRRKNRMEQFRMFGKSMGKTDEEIEQILQKAIENGTL